MLDLHTHILQGMDDGSRDLRQSMILLKREARQGVDKVILTPHFYAEREELNHFLNRRDRAFAQLQQAVQDKKKLPERFLGAEVAYFNGMSRVDGIERLCIGDTQAMLVEMPFGRWSRHVLDEILFLKECRGIRPVIAHVERYMGFQPMGTVRSLCESGIWIQANASFFLDWKTSWMARRMLKKRQIHFIGSDCHDTKRRPPNLEDAMFIIEQRLGSRTLAHLERMEQRLLEE